MSLSVKTVHLNSLALKCLALAFGYGLWHCVSVQQKIQISKKIPVCFYNTENKKITAPETITVTCSGTRNDLFKTAFDSAVHYDAHTMHTGTHILKLSKEHIILPESVRLLHYQPTEITVTVHEEEKAPLTA